MTIKIEFPSDNKEVGAAFARALTEIYGDESYRVYTGPGESKTADVDQVVKHGVKHAEEHVHASHAQLAKDGANLNGPFYWVHPESNDCGISQTWEHLNQLIDSEPLVEQVDKSVYDEFLASKSDNVPPPVVEDPKPPVTDAAEQGESEQDPAVNAADMSDTDSNGLPWDERIHSANKSTNADGSWRNRRQPKDFTGEWKEYIAEVESELKGGMQHFDYDITDDVPPPPVVDNVEPSAVFGSDTKVEDDVPPPANDDYAEYANITFPALMSYISSNMAKGSADAVNYILHEMGIEKPEGTHSALPILKAKHEDRIPEVYAKLKKELEE